MFGNLEKRTAGLMQMDDATWRRHANPLSVWTRVPLLALFALAIWSRVWIGVWAWAPVLALIIWTWFNPRIFGEPKSFDSWSARGVFGERIWINRDTIAVPKHHARVLPWFIGAQLIGAAVMAYGLIVLDGWAVIAGVVLGYAKLWFVDRCAWLFEDMKDEYPELRDLVYPPRTQ